MQEEYFFVCADIMLIYGLIIFLGFTKVGLHTFIFSPRSVKGEAVMVTYIHGKPT